MTKMTDAFKKVFLGLGGDPKELAENNDVGDYIVDLEGAIKEYVGDKTEDLIDDSEASSTKTYSSTKINSLIPANELPTPASTNLGKVATVVSDGEGGYEWSAENAPAPAPELPTPSVMNLDNVATVISDGEGVYKWGTKKIENTVLTVQYMNGAATVTGSRSDIYTNIPLGKSGSFCYLTYFPADYSYQLMGYLNFYCIDDRTNAKAIIYKGILTSSSASYDVTVKIGVTDTSLDTVIVAPIT